MSDSKSRRGVGGLPLGMIGACLLVALIERTVTRFDLDLTETSAMNWSYSQRAARSEARRAEILCFGTSLVKFGVLPKTLEDATGRTAYNLAVCNSHMPTSYFLLKRALDSGSRPAALLLDCQDGPVFSEHRDKQAEALRVNLRNWPELLSAGECLDLAWTSRDASFLASMAVSRVLPSYKARFDVRKLIMTSFQGRTDSPRATNLVFLRNWNANLGTNVMPAAAIYKPDRPVPPSPVSRVPDHFEDGRWLRNLLTETYTRRFLELADAHNIHIFWLLPPTSELATIDRQREGIDRYVEKMARTAMTISARMTVIDGSRSHYPFDAFCDQVHMNASGSTVFSESVAAVVAQSLAGKKTGGEWITLPEYAAVAGAAHATFEDVDGSRLALKEGRIGVRR